MFAFCKRSYIVPFWKGNPKAKHWAISMADGLWSSPPEEAAATKNRLGQVGPGIDEYQLSQTTKFEARSTATGTCVGPKQPSGYPYWDTGTVTPFSAPLAQL